MAQQRGEHRPAAGPSTSAPTRPRYPKGPRNHQPSQPQTNPYSAYGYGKHASLFAAPAGPSRPNGTIIGHGFQDHWRPQVIPVGPSAQPHHHHQLFAQSAPLPPHPPPQVLPNDFQSSHASSSYSGNAGLPVDPKYQSRGTLGQATNQQSFAEPRSNTSSRPMAKLSPVTPQSPSKHPSEPSYTPPRPTAPLPPMPPPPTTVPPPPPPSLTVSSASASKSKHVNGVSQSSPPSIPTAPKAMRGTGILTNNKSSVPTAPKAQLLSLADRLGPKPPTSTSPARPAAASIASSSRVSLGSAQDAEAMARAALSSTSSSPSKSAQPSSRPPAPRPSAPKAPPKTVIALAKLGPGGKPLTPVYKNSKDLPQKVTAARVNVFESFGKTEVQEDEDEAMKAKQIKAEAGVERTQNHDVETTEQIAERRPRRRATRWDEPEPDPGGTDDTKQASAEPEANDARSYTPPPRAKPLVTRPVVPELAFTNDTMISISPKFPIAHSSVMLAPALPPPPPVPTSTRQSTPPPPPPPPGVEFSSSTIPPAPLQISPVQGHRHPSVRPTERDHSQNKSVPTEGLARVSVAPEEVKANEIATADEMKVQHKTSPAAVIDRTIRAYDAHRKNKPLEVSSIPARPGTDPRGSINEYAIRLAQVTSKISKIKPSKRVTALKWRYDENSVGPPPERPPAAIFVTGISNKATSNKVLSHFKAYGTIADHKWVTDKATGGFLSMCWIKYLDNDPPDPFRRDGKISAGTSSEKQNGHVCAKEAIARNHGQRVVTHLAGTDGKFSVVFDSNGSLCAAATQKELDRRYPKRVVQPGSTSGSSERLLAPSNNTTSALPNGLKSAISLHPASQRQSNGSSTTAPKEAQTALVRNPGGNHNDGHVKPGQRTPQSSPSSRSAHNISPARQGGLRQPLLLPPSASKRKGAGLHPTEEVFSDSDSDSSQESDREHQSRTKPASIADIARAADTRNHSVPSARPFSPSQMSIASDLEPRARKHLEILQKLASQEFQYITVEKKDTQYIQKRQGVKIDLVTIRGHLRKFVPLASYEDHLGYYFAMSSMLAARAAYNQIGPRKLFNEVVPLRVKEPPTSEVMRDYEIQARLEAKALASAARAVKIKQESEWPDKKLLDEAKLLIMADLRKAFSGDLRKRVVASKISQCWDTFDARSQHRALSRTSSPEKHSQKGIDGTTAQLDHREDPIKAASGNLQSVLQIDSGQDVHYAPTGSRLPTFAKARSQAQPHKSRDARSVATAYNKTQSASPAQVREDSTGKSTPSHRPPAPSPPRDVAIRPSSKKGTRKSKPKKAVEELHFTTSEDEDLTDDDDKVKEGQTKEKLSESPGKVEQKVEAYDTAALEIKVEDEVITIPFGDDLPTAPAEVVITLPPLASTETSESNISLKRELSIETEEIVKRPRLASPPRTGVETPYADRSTPAQADESIADDTVPGVPMTDLGLTEAIVQDAKVTMEQEPAVTKILPVAKAVRKVAPKAKGGKRRGKGRKRVGIATPEAEFVQNLLAGADEEDQYYLKLALERQRMGQAAAPPVPPIEEEETFVGARHETGCARTEGYYRIPQAEKLRYLLARNQAKEDPNQQGNSALSVSRLARVNARHLASGLDKHKKATATDTDLLQLNQLRTRKKQLRFARSPIHDWGLYAMEQIPPGEMVIEYVGEQIRQQVADKREKNYERQGIGSSYLFRVDDDVVIDATMKGNLGRLINHCCTPNCTARILSVGNSKKIVIYAKQMINKGDEITYDYHFPIEDEKIVCLCGMPGCRGFLN